MLVQPDGRILAVGGRDDFELARYLPSGAIDPDFGTGGHVTLDMTSGGSERATALALLPDGKIVVGGFASSGTDSDWILARFMSNGILDPSFGTGGKLLLNLGDGTGNELHDLLLLNNSQVLAVGSVNQGTANGGVNFAAIRLDGSGQTDPTFGAAGMTTVSFGNSDDRAFAVGLQSSGKIILGGTANYAGTNARMALVRLLPDGTLDNGPAGTSFSAGKIIPTLPQSSRSQATSIIIQKDDKIVLAGSTTGSQNAVARFTPDGALDTSFGTSSPKGVWTNSLASGEITASAINAEGQIFFIAPGNFNVSIGALAPDGTVDLSYFGGLVSPARLDSIGSITAGTMTLDNQGRPLFLAIGGHGPILFRLVSQTRDVVVDVANVAPTGADIGPDLTVSEGSTVAFTPAFNDPGAEQWIYQWHVTDSLGHSLADGTSRNFNFVPPDDGVYTVQFTVSDETGSSSDVALVTATNLPPVPAVSGPTSTPEGSAVTYTTAETDPGTDTLTRHWSLKYPDGHTVDGGTDRTFTFTPPDNGAFVLTLAVMDDDGGSASKDFPINVTNVAPTFSGNVPTGVFVDQTFNLTLGASDPGQDSVSNWLVNWGDGQTVNVGPVPSLSHSYSSTGPFTISITPTDEDGTYPAVTRTIIVSPRPINILSISGTAVADAIQVTAVDDSLTVSINGALASYSLSAFQRVDVTMLDGDDTLTYSGPVPMGNIGLGNGNDAFTIDTGDVNAPITVLGGAGNDTLRINAAAARPVSFQGGTGTDSLYFTASSADDVIAIISSITSSIGGGIINPKSVTISAVEYRRVDAGAGNDTITLLDTNSFLTDQNINGEDGDDSFIVGDPTKTGTWTGRAQFAGGNGNDSVVYNDQLSNAPSTYTLTAAKMSGTTGFNFDQATIELITLNTGKFSDKIDVTPATTAAMIINAGNPGNTQIPADRLGLQPSTSGATLTLTAVDSGGYQFSDGRLQVQFTGIEQLGPNDFVRPTVTTAAFSFAGTQQSFDVAFSENVLGSVDLADLQVTNLDTSQVLPAGAFSLKITGNLATATTASWVPLSTLPDGHYRARVVAKGIADPSNNTIASDTVRDFFILAGDADHDGTIGFSDLVAVAQNYGKTTNVTFAQGDFNYDGAVNFADLVVVAQKYGITTPSAAAAVVASSFQFPVAASSIRGNHATSQPVFSVIPVAKPAPQKPIRARFVRR